MRPRWSKSRAGARTRNRNLNELGGRPGPPRRGPEIDVQTLVLEKILLAGDQHGQVVDRVHDRDLRFVPELNSQIVPHIGHEARPRMQSIDRSSFVVLLFCFFWVLCARGTNVVGRERPQSRFPSPLGCQGGAGATWSELPILIPTSVDGVASHDDIDGEPHEFGGQISACPSAQR